MTDPNCTLCNGTGVYFEHSTAETCHCSLPPLKKISKVELELQTVVNGRTWSLFTFEYQTPDGPFVGYLHALSMEHAAAMLMDLKETAVLTGQMIQVYK